MNYYESAEGVKITEQRALQEIKNHGCPDSELSHFYEELGKHEEYDAQAVLNWLGYS